MKNWIRWGTAALLVASLQLAGCKQSADTAGEEDESGPAKVEHTEDGAPAKVTLTEDAVRRLQLETAMIRDLEVNGKQQRVIPYAAILYDTQGDTWTYTNPTPLTYIRAPIHVDRIEGDLVILSQGPPAGTAVVTVGAAELYGSEIEFEEE
jgi:hypothetical protein